MNSLAFRFEREDEWHGKLFATVSADGFAGEGGAWLNTDQLREFGQRLSAFPLVKEDPPSISSGFGANADSLEQVHVSISLHPHNARGAVRATVELATEVWNGEEADLACSATVRFLVTYGDLARFGPEFLDLIDGRAVSATLQSSAE
jgi:hypothetical protein